MDSNGGGCDDPSDRPNRLGDDGALLIGDLEGDSVTGHRALPNPHALSAEEATERHRKLLGSAGEEKVTLGVREPPRGVLSAITVDAAGSEIVTAATSGSISHWSVARSERGVALEICHQREGHIMPISAACHLADGRLATGDRAGTVRIWDRTTLLGEWSVEGSIRALAAHPARPRLVVGCKAMGGGPSPGAVAIYDVD